MPSKMSDNERISKWLGVACRDFGIVATWTPALYQKIEDAGLWDKFRKILCCDILNYQSLLLSSKRECDMFKSTPAQKTKALSWALEEMEDKG